jgi:hypothetical protein
MPMTNMKIGRADLTVLIPIHPMDSPDRYILAEKHHARTPLRY